LDIIQVRPNDYFGAIQTVRGQVSRRDTFFRSSFITVHRSM